MNLIADLPLNVVKLDRIFINKCQNSHRGSHLIKETIHLLKGWALQSFVRELRPKVSLTSFARQNAMKSGAISFINPYLRINSGN